MRRATSAQAAVRWAVTRSLMSSSVMTLARSSRPGLPVTRTLRMRSRPSLQHRRLPLMKPEPAANAPVPRSTPMLGWTSSRGRPIRPRLAAEQPLGGGVGDRDDPVVVDAEDARRHARQHRLDEGAPLVVERVGLDEPGLLAQEFGGHLVERVAEMAEVSVGTARRHLDMRDCRRRPRRSRGSGGGSGRRAGWRRPDQARSPRTAWSAPASRTRSRSRARCCGGRPRSAPTSWRRWPRRRRLWPSADRSRAPRRGTGRRSWGSGEWRRRHSRSGEPADEFAIHRVLEVRRLRLGDQLGVRAFRELNDRSVALHQRGGVEAERLRPRAEIVLELRGIRLELARRCGRCRRRSARRRAGARGTGRRHRAGSPDWLR